MSSLSHPDQLAERLDQVLPPHTPMMLDHVEGEDPAVRVAVRLAGAHHPALDGEAVARIQKRILDRAGFVPLPQRQSSYRAVWRGVRWSVAACLVLVILMVSTATVSAHSVPGDALYPVKRLVEKGQLALASDNAAVNLRLKFANRRLDEFETLMKRGDVNLTPLDDALTDMNTALALVVQGDGSREDVAHRLLDLSKRQMNLAADAVSRVAPDQNKTNKLRQVVDRATDVQQQAHDLIAPPKDSQARASWPPIMRSRMQPSSLNTEMPATLLPTAIPVNDPANATAVFTANDVYTSGVPDNTLPGKKPEAVQPVNSPTVVPATVVPTATPTPAPTGDRPPASDPGTATPTPAPTENRPPASDPGTATPTPAPTGDRPPASDPGTATPTPAPTGDRPPASDPGTATPTPAPTENRPPASDPDTPPPAPTEEGPAATPPESTVEPQSYFSQSGQRGGWRGG